MKSRDSRTPRPFLLEQVTVELIDYGISLVVCPSIAIQ